MFVMHNNKDSNGFTIIEIAIVLAIIGIFLGFVLRLVIPGLEYMRVISTESKLERVADRLASFAIKNNRLPCPALPDGSGVEPFGYEIDSGANGDSPNTTCYGSDTEGIIPFMTLGISQEDIEDGWGRFITYRISPVFSLDPDTVPASQYDDVHLACRSLNWVSSSRNLNPSKARFCCPPKGLNPASNFYPNKDLIIQDNNGVLHWAATRSEDNDQYDDVDAVISSIDDIDPTVNPEVLRNEAVSFVLISHGKNAYGAFDGSTATARFATTNGQNGTFETENQNGDNIFVATETDTTNDSTYFDDILLWRTQHQLFTEFGDNTCLNP